MSSPAPCFPAGGEGVGRFPSARASQRDERVDGFLGVGIVHIWLRIVILALVRTNAFWTFRPGLTIVDIGDGTPRSPHLVTYIRVWKSANDFIRFNMVKAAGPGAKDVSTKLGSFVAGGRLRRRAVDVLQGRGSKVFTFVRSPISHFVSGYNEVEFRWMHEFVGNYSTVVIPEHCQAKGCVFHRFPIGSTDRVWAFLGDLLLGKLALLREVQHVYPQLGALPRGLPLDYVGRLESFDADWRYVLDTYIRTHSGSPQEYEFDPRVGAHNSTNYEAGAAAKRLVESDVGFVKVLEELFVLEYMCWGYEPIGSQGPRLHLRSI